MHSKYGMRSSFSPYTRLLDRFGQAKEGRLISTKITIGDDVLKYFTDLSWKYKTTCIYPRRNLRVAPDGTVTPCVGYVINNVVEEDVKNLRNNSRFRKFRSILYRQKLFPGCIRCCKLK